MILLTDALLTLNDVSIVGIPRELCQRTFLFFHVTKPAWAIKVRVILSFHVNKDSKADDIRPGVKKIVSVQEVKQLLLRLTFITQIFVSDL